ncbi:MAG: DNA translocase FtsK [Eubacterium sp.]|nr:DNA translocase FtsK [Eubacterium sp.]
MAVLKCEICGGNLSLNKGDKIAVCESCGTKQTVFYFDDSNKSDNNRFTIVQKPDYHVDIKELTENKEFLNNSSELTFALGKDYKGNLIYGDLEKLQHLLITGASGYGKTNCLRSIIFSFLCKHNYYSPKLLLIDPKKIEFVDFDNSPNLIVPIITDPRKASGALGWAVSESLRRMQAFSDTGVRDINGYNRFVESHDDMEIMTPMVIIIDDFYQVYSQVPKEIEDSVLKIIQNGRICGMHLIISSLQADRKFLPDRIKNSIPSKLSFVLRTKAESRYILDRSCAERLTTVGDMLYLPLGTSELKQIKSCYISDEVVGELREYITKQVYGDAIQNEIEQKAAQNDPNFALDEKESDMLDPLFEQAVEIVLQEGRASTSFLQRKLSVGYSRGVKLMDQLEEKGIIGPQDGAKPRDIRINMQQWIQMKVNSDSFGDVLDYSLGDDEYSQIVREINATTRRFMEERKQPKTIDDIVYEASQGTKASAISQPQPIENSSANQNNNSDYQAELNKINSEINKYRMQILKYEHRPTITLFFGIIEFIITCILVDKVHTASENVNAFIGFVGLISIASIVFGIIGKKRKPLKKEKINTAKRNLEMAERSKQLLIDKGN